MRKVSAVRRRDRLVAGQDMASAYLDVRRCISGMERAVRTPGGRDLAVEDAGHPAGRVGLVHGGTPRSRHLYGPAWPTLPGGPTADRLWPAPGYGLDAGPGYPVADWVGDVRAICAKLGIDRAMWGSSGPRLPVASSGRSGAVIPVPVSERSAGA